MVPGSKGARHRPFGWTSRGRCGVSAVSPKEEAMRRPLLCHVTVVGALVAAPAALADGPLLVNQGGAGVASNDGFHYVTVPNGTSGTLVEKIDFAHGQVYWWMRPP